MGKFNSVQIKFDKNYLSTLTEDSESGVCKQNCKYHIALHPVQLTDFGESIKEELGRKIGKYDDIFQGIMLGYENVNLQSNLGVIGVDNCYIHVDIQADFFIFRPEIGMSLKGMVTRTTKDHVGCLVYSTFNISLPKPDDDENSWLGNKASMGNEVLFKIIFVDLCSRLPYIRGELLSIVSDSAITDSFNSKKGKKLNKKIIFETNNEEGESMSPQPNKKRKKKHSMDSESMENLVNNEVGEEKADKRRKSSLEGNEGDGHTLKLNKKHKKTNNSEDFGGDVSKNIKLSIKSVDNNTLVDSTVETSKKSHNKLHNKGKKSLQESSETLKVENESFWEEVSQNIKLSINSENDKGEETTVKKCKNKKRSLNEARKSLEDPSENLKAENKYFSDEVSKNIKSSINSENDKGKETTVEKSKKKHNKSPNKLSKSLEDPSENLKVENEDFWNELSKNIKSSINSENDKGKETTVEKSKKKHNKSPNKLRKSLGDPSENLKVENEDFWNELSKNIKSSINSENDKGKETTVEKSKKKHNKSPNKLSKSLEDPSENLKVENEDFWNELSKNIKSSINSENDKGKETTVEKSKKKHNKSPNKLTKSLEDPSENLKVENEDFWNELSKNIKSSINSENDKGKETTVEKSKKKHNKSPNKLSKSLEDPSENLKVENEDFWNELSKNIKSSINSENAKGKETTVEKSKKKHNRSPNKLEKSLENPSENLKVESEDFWDEVSKNIKYSINSENNDKDGNMAENSRKKHKKSQNNDSEVLVKTENLEIKNESFWQGVTENMTFSIKEEEKSKQMKKHKKDRKSNEKLGENSEISVQNILEEEMNRVSKKHKKKKRQKPDSGDEEVLKKREERKMKKQEQKEMDASSLGIKMLYDSSFVNFSSNTAVNQNKADTVEQLRQSIKPDTNNKVPENLNIKKESFWEEAVIGENKEHKNIKKKKHEYVNEEIFDKKEKRKKRRIEAEQIGDTTFDIKPLYDPNVSLTTNSYQVQTVVDTTPTSKEKLQKNYDYSILQNIKIKKEIKKESIQDKEEIIEENKKTVQKGKKKKKEQEQNDSLESLDIKSLFDGSSISLNSSHSQVMANDEDRGKKRRKSNSVSQEVYLSHVKLEEDSELENIVSGKKRKRSKSFST